jgi:RNA recognition motif-containing protein
MGKKLYVGNLPYSVTNTELQQAFAQHGAVQSAEVIMDRETGRSKGFGFVEMGSDQDAQKAIEALHGQNMAGRILTVNEARPKERVLGRGTYGGGARGGYAASRGGYGTQSRPY